MTSLSEKLTDILLKYKNQISFEAVHYKQKINTMTTDEAKLAIIQAVLECIPQESHSTCVCDRDACWNDCRNAMIERLK